MRHTAIQLWRLTSKELRASLPALRTVIFILVIGFLGPLVAGSIRTSVQEYLSQKSRQILSADLAVNSMREFKPEELLTIQKTFRPKHMVRETDFITMAKSPEAASLVEVSGVDPSFPIYGDFTLRDESATRTDGAVNDAGLGKTAGHTVRDARDLATDKTMWVYPEVLAQLHLRLGDHLTIGRTEFKITAVVEQGPGMGQMGMAFAPKVYVSRQYVERTGLTQGGSQVYHRVFVDLPRGLMPEIAALQIKESLDDPDIFLKTPDDSVQSFERFFHFFNLYLVVITMVVFSLSWISAFYILQIYLQDRLRNAAILMSVGASRLFTAILYTLQITAVMALSFAIAWLLVKAAFAGFHAEWQASLPKDFVISLGLRDSLMFLGVAVLSAASFVIPLFKKLFTLKLGALLREDALTVLPPGFHFRAVLSSALTYLPLIVIFLGLSIWLMGSTLFACEVFGGMAAAGLGGLLLGLGFFKLLYVGFKRVPGLTRLVTTNLSRARFGTNLCFLALVLIALVLNLVPHLLKSVSAELQPVTTKDFPALFLFNMPESEVENIAQFVKDEGAELRFLSPLIQARVLKINGEPPDSDYLLRYPVRISYRAKPIPSETIVAGHEFAGPFVGEPVSAQSGAESALPGIASGKVKAVEEHLPGISVEAKFAERQGFKLGDHLSFDVQGIPVEGVVVNLRRVRWTDFNPNFFMLFQTGVLEDAPKTFLANVMIKGEGAKVRVQFDLLKKFPDLSVIDIGRTIARGLEVAASVIGPIRTASWLAVAMTFLILTGVVSHNLILRRSEMDIQKMMGAGLSLIRRLVVCEYLALGLVAYVIGAAAAIGLDIIVTKTMLEITTQVSWLALGLSLVITLAATGGIAAWAASQMLALRGTSRKL